jgi:hypothetical protein
MSASRPESRRFERRAAPRDDKLASLQHWLETARRSAGLQALALSDDQGCLIAGAGLSRLCDELAALAPSSLVTAPAAVNTNSLAIAHGQAYLCAQSRLLEQEALSYLAAGCARILEL